MITTIDTAYRTAAQAALRLRACQAADTTPPHEWYGIAADLRAVADYAQQKGVDVDPANQPPRKETRTSDR